MYNIHTQKVHVPYEKQQYIKKINHYITTYTLNSIPPSPHPCPQFTHTHEYETGSGWHVQINQKAWRKKCGFRLTLKVGRVGEALRSAGSEFQTVGAM